MKILLISPLCDYGYKERGVGWDAMNLADGLVDAGEKFNWDIKCFHPDMEDDQEKAWKDFLKLNWYPDIIIENYFQEHLEIPDNFLKYFRNCGAIACRWDCDSHKRTQSILQSKDRYDWFITADSRMVPWYQSNGLQVVSSMFAAGPDYKNLQLERDIDVSFIGQPYLSREPVIQALQKAGIRVRVFGRGWRGIWGHDEFSNLEDYRYITYPKMIEVLNRSKISLNFSEVNHGGLSTEYFTNIKGRSFEIPACGALQISTPCELLSRYFVPDDEIVIVNSVQELIDKIQYFLSNEGVEERLSIAKAGEVRVSKEHRWYHRYQQIIEEIFYGC